MQLMSGASDAEIRGRHSFGYCADRAWVTARPGQHAATCAISRGGTDDVCVERHLTGDTLDGVHHAFAVEKEMRTRLTSCLPMFNLYTE